MHLKERRVMSDDTTQNAPAHRTRSKTTESKPPEIVQSDMKPTTNRSKKRGTQQQQKQVRYVPVPYPVLSSYGVPFGEYHALPNKRPKMGEHCQTNYTYTPMLVPQQQLPAQSFAQPYMPPQQYAPQSAPQQYLQPGYNPMQYSQQQYYRENYCPECGQSEKDCKFCSNCGHKRL